MAKFVKVSPGAGYLISLCVSFFICNKGGHCTVMSITWANVHKQLKMLPV